MFLPQFVNFKRAFEGFNGGLDAIWVVGLPTQQEQRAAQIVLRRRPGQRLIHLVPHLGHGMIGIGCGSHGLKAFDVLAEDLRGTGEIRHHFGPTVRRLVLLIDPKRVLMAPQCLAQSARVSVLKAQLVMDHAQSVLQRSPLERCFLTAENFQRG